MRILILGNSFTFYNDMPSMLSEITGAEIIAHTRGGARLAEQLNPATETGAKTLAALDGSQSWDYVILQGQSSEPVLSKEAFLKSAAGLCEKIHAIGAVPLLYSTWAYQKDSAVMQEMTQKHGLSYDDMYEKLASAYREAADQNDAIVANVGKVFHEESARQNLYIEDGKHPNETGSRLAAETLAAAIAANPISTRSSQNQENKIILEALQPRFSVCKVTDYSGIDLTEPFCFTGTTDEENSLVCPESLVPKNTTERDDGWKGFRIIGQLDFSLIGILAGISKVLASNEIGIFAISTFNTDYILTKEENFEKAMMALKNAGYEVKEL